MLPDVVKTLIFCIALRSVATQGQQRAKYHKTDESYALKQPLEKVFGSDSFHKRGVGCSEEYGCSPDGDSLIDTITNVDTEVLCQELCQIKSGCGFYTWYDHSTSMPRICLHFTACNDPEPCTGCHSAPPSCPSTPNPTSPKPPSPEDCSSLAANPPDHGTLECYTSGSGKDECYLFCDPGYATTGPSVVPCTRSAEATVLSCEPSVVLITGGDQAVQQVEVYSSSTNSCRISLPSLNGPFSDHTLDYVDGHVLLCGGSTYSDMCFTLLPDLSWSPHSNLTRSRSHQASATCRDSLLLMGGDDSSTEVWSPSTGWLAGEALPQGTLDGCATRISATEMLLTGGHHCPTCSFIFNRESSEWRQVGDLGEGRSSHGCASYISPEDGKVRVLVAGGWSGHNIRTAEVFNPATERWRVVGDLSSPRRGLSLQTAEGGRVVALGGRYSQAVADVDIFDPEVEIWEAGFPLLRRRAYHASTSVPPSMVGCQL